MSIIPSNGSIISTPTLSIPRHLSSTQSIGLTLQHIPFATFCPLSFTSITGLCSHSSLLSPLQSTSISSMPASVSSSVNTASDSEDPCIVLSGKYVCSYACQITQYEVTSHCKVGQ